MKIFQKSATVPYFWKSLIICVFFITSSVYADPVFKIQSGNVGIGTTTPGANVGMTGGLTVNGSSDTQFVIEKNNSSAFAVNVSQTTAGDVNFYDYVVLPPDSY